MDRATNSGRLRRLLIDPKQLFEYQGAKACCAAIADFSCHSPLFPPHDALPCPIANRSNVEGSGHSTNSKSPHMGKSKAFHYSLSQAFLISPKLSSFHSSFHSW